MLVEQLNSLNPKGDFTSLGDSSASSMQYWVGDWESIATNFAEKGRLRPALTHTHPTKWCERNFLAGAKLSTTLLLAPWIFVVSVDCNNYFPS